MKTRAPKNKQPLSFQAAITIVFNKYADFNGRASRPEFWWWVLFTALVAAVIGTLSDIPFGPKADLGNLLNSMWSVIILLPTLAVGVRRLRDAGYSWNHMFWLLVPFAGLIVLVIMWAQPSQKRRRT